MSGKAQSTKRMSPGDRKAAELAASIDLRAVDKPVFPYPSDLREEYKPYWLTLVNSKPADYFTNGDIPLLKMYCRAAWEVDELDVQIRREGHTIEGAKGGMILNPAVTARSIAETRILSLATKLRCQPSSRMDSENDKKQTEKSKRAQQTAKNLLGGSGDDDSDLIARPGHSTH